jgi:signal transduction histidine kinase
MRRLFRSAKRSSQGLNLWFLFLMLLSIGVCLMVLDCIFVFGRLQKDMNSLCVTTYRSYERGGRQELNSILQWVEEGLNTKAFLLDSQGRDLATGDDRSSLLATARNSAGRIPLRRPVTVITPSSSYICIVERLQRPQGLPVGPLLWVLSFLSISCCTVAGYLTLRMRRIEIAVGHFGSGQLDVRVTPDSGDPIGRISRAFNDMADRIQTIVASQQRLCEDISHELRSPLARLLLAVRAGRRGAPETFDRIEKEVGRVNELLNELLELTFVEGDPSAIQVEEVDVQSILTEIVDRCTPEAHERNCAINLSFSRIGSVEADPELLWRAVENVLRNAVRYSPSGAAIDLAAAKDAEFAVITVRDRGRGVPEYALDDIFRPRYRVERNRNSEGGVGLGLAIAQRAITLQGGTISAENCLPGLCVEIRLPRRQSRYTS